MVGGWVEPHGSPTTYFIRYATQPDFSDAVSIPLSEDLSAGSGQEAVAVSSVAESLTPATEYFFQVVANSPAGDSDLGHANV